MVALVTQINGVAFALFHVEHSAGEVWRFRWRIASACPAGYDKWREQSTDACRVMVQPEISGCRVEVEWSDGAGGPWRQASLHALAAGVCWFRVRALADFRFPGEPLRAIAAVGGVFVAEYVLPPVDLAAGEWADVMGTAVGALVDNVLHVPGEFCTVDARLRIENLDASSGSLVSCDAVPVLSPSAAGGPRRVWARVATNSRQT